MGFGYALVHVKFTIPLAIILGLVTRPVLTRLDAVRIIALITIAVTATIPWDSYLIRTGVWTYPDDGVIGYTLFDIPIEEVFFFFIQTYITSVIYIICSKPVLMAQHLSTPQETPAWIKLGHVVGQLGLAAATAGGAYLVLSEGEATYMGLILAWACPFLFITWTLTGDMLLSLPWQSTVLPIMIPTVYLWFVDELSLRTGAWVIESGTKLEAQLFGSLEIEEAVFFLVTNMLIVFGIAAIDKAAAVCDAFPDRFAEPADSLPAWTMIRARFAFASTYDMHRVNGIREAVVRLQRKSRSFYMASSVFPGRLRIDLTLLYSYCRLADDLVDEAETPAEAKVYINKLRKYLDLKYSKTSADEVHSYIRANFPPSAYSALDLLPTHILSPKPLYELLAGFETDLDFQSAKAWPIHDEDDLELYASRVASTVGELCLNLVFHHASHTSDVNTLLEAARSMGIALQYVNIARDVTVDTYIQRVYLPTTWLKEYDLTPESVIHKPHGLPAVDKLRTRLLDKAFARYKESRPAMDKLPSMARGPMTVAVESYMEIGRVLSEGGMRIEGKATVNKWRRLGVVWKTLMAS